MISRLADVFFAFPGLLLAILVAAVFGQAVTEQYGSTARLVLVAVGVLVDVRVGVGVWVEVRVDVGVAVGV